MHISVIDQVIRELTIESEGDGPERNGRRMQCYYELEVVIIIFLLRGWYGYILLQGIAEKECEGRYGQQGVRQQHTHQIIVRYHKQ